MWSIPKTHILTISLGLLISQNEIESGKTIFSEHLPLSKLQQGIKSGTYLQGTFRASRENYLEATVWVHGDDEDNKEASVYMSSFHTKIFLFIFFFPKCFRFLYKNLNLLYPPSL